jgi:hypothetical protein
MLYIMIHKYSKVNLFADDILLLIAGENLADCLKKMNEDLKSLTKWLRLNKMKLNVSKTKYMIVTRSRVPWRMKVKCAPYNYYKIVRFALS